MNEADGFIVPAGREGTCAPVVVGVTDNDFFMVNPLKAENFIWARLNELEVLSFWIENLPKDAGGCPGWWMFERVMEHFAGRVVAIVGNWIRGDNIDRVNELTSAGVSLDEASLATTTAKYARAYGFVRLTVLATVGVPGAYSKVKVLFEQAGS